MPTPALIQGPLAKPPLWLRVTRRGNHFAGSYSADGKSWTILGMDDVPMTGKISVGLVATSAEQTRLCTVDFQQVTVTP
jgi:regulation of enolase protein 1 (concanavalin A-like superfamily)